MDANEQDIMDYDNDTELDTAVADAGDDGVECQFLTGSAGTGKTTLVKQRIADDPGYALLCATTGIAAVNLDCTTLNSRLGYFDEASLRDIYVGGRLGKRLRDMVRGGVRNLLIEECSMLTGTALDILHRAAKDTATSSETGRPLGLILVGDMCQLPPINGSWMFEADCWPQFEQHTERLTHIWRQDQQGFIDALNAARSGDGERCAAGLASEGVRFENMLDMDFDGTTILPLNKQVEPYNADRLSRVRQPLLRVASRRWGKQRGEWKNIPEQLELKIGAYVMILANAPGGSMEYVNGDCGHVVDYTPEDEQWHIKLVRNDEVVSISAIVRNSAQKDKPDNASDYVGNAQELHASDRPWRGQFISESGKVSRSEWVLGQVQYLPLRLAYATTVHKSQGLSLDKVQVDFRHRFFGSPAMLYTSLSRCRTMEGLRLVGDGAILAQRCNTDKKVQRWL